MLSSAVLIRLQLLQSLQSRPPTADWEVINLRPATTFYLPPGAPHLLSLHTTPPPLTIWLLQDTATTSGRDRAGLDQIGTGDGKMTAESSWRKMQEQSIAFKQTAEKEELIFVVFCGHQMQICWSQLTLQFSNCRKTQIYNFLHFLSAPCPRIRRIFFSNIRIFINYIH